MSINLMSAIFQTEFCDLRDDGGNVTKASTAKLVLLAMADHANEEGEGAYPSIEKLCLKTALSEQTIRNTFDALRHNGIIALEGKSKWGTNNHTINTKSFPKSAGKHPASLTLYPVGGITGEVGGYNRSLEHNVPVIPESSITTNESSIGVPPNFGIDWQIGAGVENIQQVDDDMARMRDAANLIATGTGARASEVCELVMAFQIARKKIFTTSDIKSQRKAVKSMVEKNIRPEHVTEAVQKLITDGMTVTDLYSVTKTADNIANPPPETSSMNPQRLEIGI